MNRKRQISIILFLLSGIFLALGLFFILKGKTARDSHSLMSVSAQAESEETQNLETKEDEEIDSEEENLQSVFSENSQTEEESNSENDFLQDDVEESSEEILIPVRIDNPYKEYFLQNSDMAAWLKIPDTIIDYPVMWTPEDEEYYLLRGFDGKKNSKGCLILDTDSCMEPLTTNLIIHGHNYRGAMFGELDKYEEKSYRDKHPYIFLYGEDYEHVYEVMAVFRSQVFYTTDICFKYYKFFQADTQEEFDDFYGNVKAMAEYETGVEASFGDHFITLSTCAYHTENGRLVVVGKEINPGDYYQPIDRNDTEKNKEEE